jgi:hypothetical protein
MLGNGSDKATMEYTLKYNPPMDLTVAKTNLKEIKQVLEQLGVVFILGSGTCLGATRDKALMPWDDDIDLLSVLGVNGLTEAKVDAVADALRGKGYFIREFAMANSKAFATVKNYVRISLECVRTVDDIIYLFPGGFKIPASMFTQPKEIEFLGEQFLVPNPPEDYLRLKYGEEWMVPKKAGEYEIDVVGKIPDAGFVGQPLRIRVIDHEGNPVSEAEVVLVGSGRSRTDQGGYAQLLLPGPDFCSLIIRYPEHEQVLYMEEIEPGQTYVYRADAASKAASGVSGEIGTLGNLLLVE